MRSLIFLLVALSSVAGLTPPASPTLTRRCVCASAAASAAAILAGVSPAFAATLPKILVLGASGRSGMAVVDDALRRGLPTITATRTGTDPFAAMKKMDKTLLTNYAPGCDVKDPGSVKSIIAATNPDVVVFAASASKRGGNAKEVDLMGVMNVADATPKGKRLVIISALAVDRPDSEGYRMTNNMGGVVDNIMSYKLQGEDYVRKTSSDYAIIRPGVLMNGKKGAEQGMELAQGDFYGGGLSREELAKVVVDSAVSKNSKFTVEAYRKQTRTALQKELNNEKAKFVSSVDDASKD